MTTIDQLPGSTFQATLLRAAAVGRAAQMRWLAGAAVAWPVIAA